MAPGRRHALNALALLLWIVAQWCLFAGYVERAIAWAYPGGSDQVATLARAYQANDVMRTRGLAAGAREAIASSGAPGTLLPLQAALFQQAFGRTRLASLSVGFAYLAAFQVVLVLTLVWLSGRWSVGWLGLGLLLAARAPFQDVGGWADLRQDTSALGLMGIFVGAAVRSDAFARRGWALAAAGAALVLVAMRTLTSVYLAGILGTFALLVWWRARRAPEGDPWRARRTGLAWAVALFGLATSALVAVKWTAIRDYYVVGHLTGPDRLLHHLGAHDLGAILLFYPTSFARDHAGWPLLVLAALVVLAAAVSSRGHARPPEAARATEGPLALAALACVVPYVVLTTDQARSIVVIGIVLGPAVWLTALLVVRLSGAVAGAPRPPRVERTLALCAVLALGVGACLQWTRLHAAGPYAPRAASVQSAKDLHQMVALRARARGWQAPVVIVDRLAESLVPSIATTESAERLGFVQRVRFGLWRYGAIPQDEAEAAIDRADFVLLSQGAGPSAFPFDGSLAALHDVLVLRCARAHQPIGRFRVDGLDAVLYERR